MQIKVFGLVNKFKANCLLVRPGPVGGLPSVRVFLRDHNPTQVSEKTTIRTFELQTANHVLGQQMNKNIF